MSSLELVEDEVALVPLAEDWRLLASASPRYSIYSSFEWISAWVRTRAANDARLQVLVFRSGSRVRSIAPLCHRVARWGPFTVRKIEPPGASFADQNDVILSDDGVGELAQVIAFLSKRDDWDLLDMPSVPKASTSLAALRAAATASRLDWIEGPAAGSPFIKVNGDSWHHTGMCSQHFRQNMRLARRRLHQVRGDDVRIRFLEEPHLVDDFLSRLAALEAMKSRRGRKTHPVISPAGKFLQELAATAGPKGWLYLALMEHGTAWVAYQFGFRWHRRLCAYNAAFDPKYAQLSPGHLLIAATLDYAFDRGFDEYDMLAGEEEYKRRWTQESHPMRRILIWNRSPRARLARLAFRTAWPAARALGARIS